MNALADIWTPIAVAAMTIAALVWWSHVTGGNKKVGAAIAQVNAGKRDDPTRLTQLAIANAATIALIATVVFIVLFIGLVQFPEPSPDATTTLRPATQESESVGVRFIYSGLESTPSFGTKHQSPPESQDKWRDL